MSALPSHLDRKPSARTGISQTQATPASPHTPRRTQASPFSSPGASYRSDEDVVVLEVGARHLDAGFANDSFPKYTYRFSGEDYRRIGDFRRWLPGYSRPVTRPPVSSVWGIRNELWRLDLSDLEIGLIEDKLERAIRDAYSRVLLQDSKTKRVLLVLPSLVPQAIVFSIVALLFRNFLVPELMLLSTPSVSVFGAGKRSGLVVDIGWRETVITAVYEFREIHCERTTRAMRQIVLAMARLLDKVSRGDPLRLEEDVDEDLLVPCEFDFAEDVTMRLAWCRDSGQQNLQNVSEGTITLPKDSKSHETMELRFEDLSLPAETVFFPSSDSERNLDDEEHTIHYQLYQVLTSLSQDARALCASNIIFTGGGSQIPGLRTRLLAELNCLVLDQGWDPIWGEAAKKYRERLKEIDHNRRAKSQSNPNKTGAINGDDTEEEDRYEGPAAFVDPVEDPITKKLREDATKLKIDEPSREPRCIETLGAWAGASLAASLKIKGVVQIEKETFMQHGMAGAVKEKDLHIGIPPKSRQSMGGANIGRAPVAFDSSAWTLGLWET